MSLFRKNGYKPTQSPVNPLPPNCKPIYKPQPKEVVVKIKDEPFWNREEPQPNTWYVCLYNNGFPCVLGWSEVNYIKDRLLCWHKLPPYESR